VDGFSAALVFVVGGDVADGFVEADVVVVDAGSLSRARVNRTRAATESGPAVRRTAIYLRDTTSTMA